MPSPPPWVSDSDMHHGTCATHVLWCMPGSLTSGFLWSRWQGKRSRHSRRMRNPQFYVSGKRPMPNQLEALPPPHSQYNPQRWSNCSLALTHRYNLWVSRECTYFNPGTNHWESRNPWTPRKQFSIKCVSTRTVVIEYTICLARRSMTTQSDIIPCWGSWIFKGNIILMQVTVN